MTPRDAKLHRRFAVESFNATWKLVLKKRRTRADDVRMVHLAHASSHHWGIAGGPRNWAIGEWQVSHVYAFLRRAEPALYHARQCLETCRKHDVRDFPLAYAYEALARASHIAGRRRDVARWWALAAKAGSKIARREDREQFFRDLATLPLPRSLDVKPGGARRAPRRRA